MDNADFTAIQNIIINIAISLIIVAVAFLCYFLIKKIISRFLKRVDASDSKNVNKKKTILKLINNILKYVFVILATLIILDIFGVNITSIIAGIGVASVIIGLALQDALKDIIMGFNIIVDDYYSVGDLITVGDVHGTVVELGLKATKIKDFDNDNIYVVGNRNIVSAFNESDMIIAEIPMPYEESVETCEDIIRGIMDIARAEQEELDDIEYVGISSFGESAVYYRLKLRADPHIKYQVRRNVYRIIKTEMDKNGIEIPYTQLDVHNKS